MIAAGRLNRRVNIEQRGSTQDAVGQPVETWTLVASVWADIRYPSGLSSIRADADVSVGRVSVRIRNRSGIDAGMRVVYGDEVFDIKSVLPNYFEHCLDLVCEVSE